MPTLVGLPEVNRVALKTDPWSTRALKGTQQVWSKGDPSNSHPAVQRTALSGGPQRKMQQAAHRTGLCGPWVGPGGDTPGRPTSRAQRPFWSGPVGTVSAALAKKRHCTVVRTYHSLPCLRLDTKWLGRTHAC